MTEDEGSDLLLRTVKKEPSLMLEVINPRQIELVASTSDEPGDPNQLEEMINHGALALSAER